jgi:hypothetical protein
MTSSVNLIALLWGILSGGFMFSLVNRALAISDPASTLWSCIVTGALLISAGITAILSDRVFLIRGDEEIYSCCFIQSGSRVRR